MPRTGLNAEAIVDIALAVLDEQGADALTLAVVASRAGVATPSLYKHVRSLAELRTRLSTRILGELTDAATGAAIGRSGDEAVIALMQGLRAYAVEHPTRYPFVPADPLHDRALAEAAGRLLTVIMAVLRPYGLDGPAAVHATRCLRVIVHGFSSIESSGGFGMDEDRSESYEQLIGMYLAYLHDASAPSTT